MVTKPSKKEYPLHPQTLGEHIKKKRMDKGFFQKEVAIILGTSEDTITYWENARSQPQVHCYPKIFAFLEYYPFDHKTDTIAGKLRQLRYCNGMSYKEFSILLGADTGTIKRWECHKGKPKPQKAQTIIQLLQALPAYVHHLQTNTKKQ